VQPWQDADLPPIADPEKDEHKSVSASTSSDPGRSQRQRRSGGGAGGKRIAAAKAAFTVCGECPNNTGAGGCESCRWAASSFWTRGAVTCPCCALPTPVSSLRSRPDEGTAKKEHTAWRSKTLASRTQCSGDKCQWRFHLGCTGPATSTDGEELTPLDSLSDRDLEEVAAQRRLKWLCAGCSKSATVIGDDLSHVPTIQVWDLIGAAQSILLHGAMSSQHLFQNGKNNRHRDREIMREGHETGTRDRGTGESEGMTERATTRN
jgi:hypothetical protein